jgi:hypothetical protein
VSFPISGLFTARCGMPDRQVLNRSSTASPQVILS